MGPSVTRRLLARSDDRANAATSYTPAGSSPSPSLTAYDSAPSLSALANVDRAPGQEPLTGRRCALPEPAMTCAVEVYQQQPSPPHERQQ